MKVPFKNKIFTAFLLFIVLVSNFPILSPLPAKALPPTLLFSDDFESGTGLWTGGLNTTTSQSLSPTHSANVSSKISITMHNATLPASSLPNSIFNFTISLYCWQQPNGASNFKWHDVSFKIYMDDGTDLCGLRLYAENVLNTYKLDSEFFGAAHVTGGDIGGNGWRTINLVANFTGTTATLQIYQYGLPWGTAATAASSDVAGRTFGWVSIQRDAYLNPPKGTLCLDNVYLDYTPPYTPTVTSIAITDRDDTNNIYSMKKFYSFRVIANDGNGAATIKKISIKIIGAGGNVAFFTGDNLQSTPTWTSTISTWIIDSTTCSWVTAGDSGTAIFKIKSDWNMTEEANLAIAASVLDFTNINSTWTITPNYCDEINRLVVYGLSGSRTTSPPNGIITITGNIRYATSPTSNTASSSYPPDAQFTNVEIWDDLDVIMGTDNTIVDGAFSATFVTSDIDSGTSQNYYVYVNLVPPGTDAFTSDGRHWYVKGVSAGTLDVLSTIFALFGLADYLSYVVSAIQSLATYFINTLAFFVSMTIQIVVFVIYIMSTLLFWVTTFLDIIANPTYGILPNIWRLFTGAIGLAGTTYNFVTGIFTATNLYFFGILLFIYWFDALARRGRQTGQNWVQVMIGDMQIATFIVGYAIDIAFRVFNFVLDLIMRFATGILASI